MELTDLIIIGRLGNFFLDKGYLFRKNENFQPSLTSLEKIFLILTDEEVRYVVASYEDDDDKLYIKFPLDDDLRKEIALFSNVQCAVAPDDYHQFDEVYFNPLSYDVFDEGGLKFGVVEDFFFNSAHYVIEFSYQGKEVMIPCVEEFIAEVNEKKRRITIKNASGLLAL